MIRASVAMAVYNGEKYICQQIDSIINMMALNDELIISYDISTDNTLQIIKNYEKNDSRIHVVYDSGHSVEENFNNAVANCRGKYIFLADQDDIWINEKLNVMVEFFKNHTDCVVLISDAYITDGSLSNNERIFSRLNTSPSPVRNIIRGTYLGCQMAFDSRIKNYVWPVSVNPALPHDLWLGVFGSFYGDVELLNMPLIVHRIHDGNYSKSSKMNIIGVIFNRLWFMLQITKRYIENKFR